MADKLNQCPEPGYYYHYKHDPNGPLNNYAYYKPQPNPTVYAPGSVEWFEAQKKKG